MEPACFAKNFKVPGDRRENIVDETNKVEVEESQEISSTVNLTIEPTEFINAKTLAAAGLIPMKTDSIKHIPLMSPSDRG